MRTMAVGALVLALMGVPAPAPALLTEGPEARGMELVANVPFENASHLEFLVREIDGVTRTFAVAGSRDNPQAGLRIIDVTDPENPELTAHVRCGPNVRNQDPAVSPDGMYVLITAENDRRCPIPGFRLPGYAAELRDVGIVDVTDPAAPILRGTRSAWPDFRGVHTAVFHPVENVAYLSNQETPDRTPQLGIIDLRPGPSGATGSLMAMPPLGSGPHDITFNADGTRAYVSAITATYILDTTDVLQPTVISYILDPSIAVHHEALLHPGGRYLFVTDERLSISNTGGIPLCPGGGVHVYDLFDERLPVKVGLFHADDLRQLVGGWDPEDEIPSCTSHEGNFSLDGTKLSIAWYYAGSRVFDVSALAAGDLPPGAPVGMLVGELAFIRPEAVDNWASKFHPHAQDYILATNQKTGLDVYRLAS